LGDFSPSIREGEQIMLSKQAIEEFQDIYLKTYGRELSFDDAAEQAHQLIRFFKFALGYPLNYQTEDTKNE
jgi:hypothetical protein